MITVDDFFKVEMRVGKVVEAIDVEKSEKLIRLRVDFKDEERIIFTGVRIYGYSAKDFDKKQFIFVTNIPYRKMLGEESQGMILAVDGDPASAGQASKPIFVSAEGMPVGAKVR